MTPAPETGPSYLELVAEFPRDLHSLVEARAVDATTPGLALPSYYAIHYPTSDRATRAAARVHAPRLLFETGSQQSAPSSVVVNFI